jgi:hypothetical protein
VRPSRRLLAVALVAFVALAAAVGGAVAGAGALTVRATPKRITPAGVGGVKLGRTYTALRRDHLVGRIHRGCELDGPNARAAVLRAPLKGFVAFTQSSPRKVTTIGVSGGATARGIGIGASQARVRRAFPKATVDHSTESQFDVTLVTVPRSGGGPLQFAIVSMTKTVTMIGIPRITFCE